MKLISLSVAAAALSFLVSTAANASLLLEPYLGYHTGKTDDVNQSGVSYGGRVGFQRLGLMGGIDYMTGKWTDNDKPSNDRTPADLGVFVGYNFPVLLRIYGVYDFDSKMHAAHASVSDDYKGSGFKLGIGYTLLPLVSINLEYVTDTFTKDNGGTLSTKITDKMYGLTVSVPLTFM